MKIYIKNVNALTKKEEIIGYLTEIGIKEENIIFSDCWINRNKLKLDICDCEKWDLDSRIENGEKIITIYFGMDSWFENYKPHFINIFTKKTIEELKKCLFNYSSISLIYFPTKEIKEIIIVINVGICLENNGSIKYTLYHELIHTKNKDNMNNHCLNNGCYFSEDKNLENPFLCENCKNILKEISEEINKNG